MKRYVSLAGAALAVATVLSPLPSQARIENDPALLVAAKVPDAAATESTTEAAAQRPAEGEEVAVVASGLRKDRASLVRVPAPEAAADHERAGAENEARARKVAAPRGASGLEKLIATRAAEHGVPLALARAVIRVESNFQPGVTGRAGEVGLMQIKPATARGIGYRGSVKGLYDPATNLAWGMKYLAGAYKLAGGSVCGTIMRYQGGHYASHMTAASTTYCSRVKRYMGSA